VHFIVDKNKCWLRGKNKTLNKGGEREKKFKFNITGSGWADSVQHS
jgi:hypothetical protein